MSGLPGDSIFIVIPAFNEERCVGRVVTGIRKFLPKASILVVDDGSADKTGACARLASATVLRMPVNSGYGIALQAGLVWAHRMGAQMCITMDADGQHEPAELAKLVRPISDGDADLVLGSRYLNGSAGYAVPLVRRLGSWIFASVVTRIIGQKISDPTTGFQAMNRKVLGLYASLDEFPERTPDADLIIYASLRHCRIIEVPVLMHADQGPGSMHGLVSSTFYVPRMLASIASVLASRTRKQVA